MAISEKNYEYINNIRKNLENDSHPKTRGFNISRTDDGMDALRQEVENKEMRDQPVFDNNEHQDNYSIFDNATSIIVDDPTLRYDEQSLDFEQPEHNGASQKNADNIINDDGDGQYDDGRLPQGDGDGQTMKLSDVINRLTSIRAAYGDSPCAIRVDDDDYSITDIQRSQDGYVRIIS